MGISALSFSAMGVFVKKLSPAIPHFELVFFRSWINLLAVVLIVRGDRRVYFPKGIKLLIFRGLFGTGSLAGLFYTITHLPLSVAVLIGWCSPIFVYLFSWTLLGESIRLSAFRWIAMAFVGLILTIRPDFSAGVVSRLPLSAVLIGLVGSASAGMAYVAVRAATAQAGVQTIILYFVGIATLISAPIAAVQWVAPNFQQWTELLIMGGFATIGQYMMTQGYRFAPAGIVSTMSLTAAVYSAFFGWWIFDERLDAMQILGMLILGSGIALLALSSQKMSGSKIRSN